jgi:hypothetical protein
LKNQEGGTLMYITRKDLVSIKYSEDIGYTYKDLVFNDLLDPTDTSLPLEKAIKTDFNVIITWTISADWIVIPVKNEEIHFFNYMPLVDFLRLESSINMLPIIEQPTSRELFLDEYIQSLKTDLDLLQQYVAGKVELCLDQLIYLAKEYRTPGILSAESLIKAVQSEIEQFSNMKQNFKSYFSMIAI